MMPRGLDWREAALHRPQRAVRLGRQCDPDRVARTNQPAHANHAHDPCARHSLSGGVSGRPHALLQAGLKPVHAYARGAETGRFDNCVRSDMKDGRDRQRE
jgi:hypothetical protein